MKKLKLVMMLLVLISMISACGTGTGATYKKDYSTLNSLADVLRLQPGLVISGGGNAIQVQIRGTSTIQLATQPLYVVDDVPMGRNYAQAANAVNVKDIVEVEILKGTSATTIYGVMGNNGVIKIKTKKNVAINQDGN
ncbi:MAG: TonB-dependent receptor plug domain-containing protein [Saprospiraceae bacterium]|nr:TonB-dependent receptor plug domain-containing protein [Saprospiraceae bacterium]